MSLFGSIRLGANALHAEQIALQVVGQNIANANTPDYIREEAVLAPAMSQKIGNLTLGLGVRVEAVIQKIDKYLEERLRGAVSDKSSAEAQRDVYAQLEQLLGTLEETGIAPSMTRFFNSVSQVLNQPEDVSVRNQAVLDAQRLTSEVNTLARNVRRLRLDVNERIAGMADQINGLVEQIRDLNLQIMSCEAGIFTKSEAVGLRDQRQAALGKLAELVNIRVKEDDTGSLTVYVGSQFLVNDGIVNRVMTSYAADRGMSVASIRFVGTDSPLEATSGQLHGMLAARDDGLGGFLDALNDCAGTLAFEFNKIFSGGQGLRGYDAATSQSRATAADQPLDQAGLSFTPVNGSFRVLVYDTETKTTRSTVIPVRLLGDSNDTTLQSLADALNPSARFRPP
jgi:flagellar hook-associated protein 1 FlgK